MTLPVNAYFSKTTYSCKVSFSWGVLRSGVDSFWFYDLCYHHALGHEHHANHTLRVLTVEGAVTAEQ